MASRPTRQRWKGDLIRDQLAIPFTGATPASRHTSLDGARVCRAGSQAARLLLRYLDAGAQTDGQMARALGLPEARISARRSGLIKLGLVAHEGIVQGPYGAKNCTWTLTEPGRRVAGQLRSHA